MNSLQFVFTFPGGKLKQDVTSITLVNNTALTVDITVPTGKRWFLLSIKMMNPDNVVRAVQIKHFKEAAKTNLIGALLYAAALGGLSAEEIHTPNLTVSTAIDWAWSMRKILDAGNTLECYWAAGGISAGGVDADGLVIEYLEIDI